MNPVTNKIYVSNNGSGNVTVIDGATNTTTTVATGTGPGAIAVNPVTNKIYVSTAGSNAVTVIDGATNTTATVAAGTGPNAIAVNPVTNEVYVANGFSGNVTLIAAAPTILTRHAVGVASGALTTAAAPTLSFSVCCAYQPNEPPVRTVYYRTGDALGDFTAANGAGPFTATVTSLQLGQNYVIAYAVDSIEGTSINTGGGGYYGTSSMIGAPSVFPLILLPPPMITSGTTLPTAAAGSLYSQGILGTGGVGALSFTVTGGGLPNGLTLSAAGLVSGIPTVGGNFGFTVTVTDSTGGTGAAIFSLTVTTVADAPTGITATAGYLLATVAFTPPVYDGALPIIAYLVTSSPDGRTALGAASPLTVTGLTNGTAYTFTVKAINSAGTGAASAISNAVTPFASVPSAPTGVTAVAGSAQASVTFTAPPPIGGLPVATYTVTSSPSDIVSSGAASPIIVTGLTNGITYTFTVTATNSQGIGPASAPSNAVTPLTLPSMPTAVTVTAGNTQATVSFTMPVSTGGPPITSYIVTSSPDGITASGPVSPIIVTGLTNGTAYTFIVAAINAAGTGPASSPSNSVTPMTVPSAPTIGTAIGGYTQATVTFTVPASNGGAPIVSYTVTSNPSGLTATGPASPITVAGLTNGSAYTFTVVATNIAGSSQDSLPSNTVTPSVTAPGAPTNILATAGNAQATLSFATPTYVGGSPIIGYLVTSNPGGITALGTGSPIQITGLTNGIAYTFTVKAFNSVGTGPTSSPSNSVTPTTLALNTVVSRKTHGLVPFDITIDTTVGVGGAVTVEPRAIGTGHTIVAQFNEPISAPGSATIIDTIGNSAGTATTAQGSNSVVITLSNVGDNKRVTVSLTGVNGTSNYNFSVGFLVGDVNGNRLVTTTDVSAIKARSGQTADGSNFRYDLNATGSVNAGDIAAVKARVGLVLP